MGWQPWPYQGERKTIHAVKINDENPANKRIKWTAEVFIPFTLLEPITMCRPKKELNGGEIFIVLTMTENQFIMAGN